MKQLLILRHAESRSGFPGTDDHEWPLTARGRAAASNVGTSLLAHDLLPQLTICSDALRATSTADGLREASDATGELIITRELYLAEASTYIDLLQELPDRWLRVMVIGHNPGLEELLVILTGEQRTFYPATLAEVCLPAERWLDITHDTAQLGSYWPKCPLGPSPPGPMPVTR